MFYRCAHAQARLRWSIYSYLSTIDEVSVGHIESATSRWRYDSQLANVRSWGRQPEYGSSFYTVSLLSSSFLSSPFSRRSQTILRLAIVRAMKGNNKNKNWIFDIKMTKNVTHIWMKFLKKQLNILNHFSNASPEPWNVCNGFSYDATPVNSTL